MKFLAACMLVVLVVGGFVGCKIVGMVEAANDFRPNVEQIIDEIHK